MLENGLVIIVVILAFLLVCSCMQSGYSPLDKFRSETFKYKRSNPSYAKYGDLKVECDQYPSFSHNTSPDVLRVPCGATSVRKLVNAVREEPFGQEGMQDAKDDWDAGMVKNLYSRYNDTQDVIYDPENMAARGPTSQRRNQLNSIERRGYN